jgi:exosortase
MSQKDRQKPKLRLSAATDDRPAPAPSTAEPAETSGDMKWGWAWGAAFVVLFVWSYWPTLRHLVNRWEQVADYSHGFLVPPLALAFLWFRRSDRPKVWAPAPMLGLGVVAAATLFRYIGARTFLPSFDGWSIPFWLAGVCIWYGGLPLLRWCLPSLLFLLFMVPLPYRMEYAMGMPLRQVATKASCWTLQTLGQPAVEEGVKILMSEQELDVAHECSGLRMLVGITALAAAYVMFSRKPWWQKAILIASAVPVAVLANVTRVTITAFLYEHVSSEAGKTFSHDAAGWVTNCAAALLFGIVLWLCGKLFVEYEMAGTSSLIGLDGSSPAPR